MRILFTTFAYSPETSGVPIVVKNLAEGLTNRGHCVAIATRMNGKLLSSHEIINDVHVYRFRLYQSLFKIDKGEIDEYITFVRNYPKDVLVLECVQCQTTDILLPFLESMKCRIVLHSHGGPGIHQRLLKWNTNFFHTVGNAYNWFRWRRYYGLTIPKFSRMIDTTICLSLCASDLHYMYQQMKRVAIVENAADSLFFQYKANSDRVLSQVKASEYILCIANYVPNKSQIDIVRAFESVKNPDCALVLIGSKRNKYYEKVCKEAWMISERSNKEIHVLYGIDRELLPSIVGHAKLFVMASLHEEYPLSLVEAMSMGIPFLSTDVGCSRILPGGITVTDRKDLPMFMDYLESHQDILTRLGEQGLKYALENNRIEHIVSLFESHLTS